LFFLKKQQTGNVLKKPLGWPSDVSVSLCSDDKPEIDPRCYIYSHFLLFGDG
jgi:hypothetical protein